MTENNDTLRYIDFNWNGTTYTMEFNRATASYVEESLGINAVEMLTNRAVPLTKAPQLFYASLMMHHPKMKVTTANEIFDAMGDKIGLVQAMLELYSYAVNSLFEEPEEGKAVAWKRH